MWTHKMSARATGTDTTTPFVTTSASFMATTCFNSAACTSTLSTYINATTMAYLHLRGSFTLAAARPRPTWPRSEEHTSELQSRGHLVCRLLLEKKKTQ